MLIHKDSPEKVIHSLNQTVDAMDCISMLISNAEKFNSFDQLREERKISKLLDQKIFNTHERIQTDISTWKYSHGRSMRRTTDKNSGCYFQVRPDSYQ